jgi:hypothetical protein
MAKFHSLAKAFGEFDARRAASEVGFDVLAGVRRKFQV